MTTTAYTLNNAEKGGLFRTALRLDAGVTLASGFGLIIGANALADLFGLADGSTMLASGVFLLLYGATMLYYGFIRAGETPVWFRWVTTEIDFAWALGSLAIAFTGAFGMNDLGRAFMFVSGIAVMGMAAAKYIGLRRMQ